MRITLWLFLILAVALGITWDRIGLDDARPRLDRLPLQGPGYLGQDVPLSDSEKSALATVNVIKRHYMVADQEICLTVLDGTHNRSAVHDPSYCYAGEGWHVVDRHPISLADGEVERVVMNKAGETKEVLIWFSDGQRRFAGIGEYWLLATVRRLTLGYSGEEPVRVIVQPVADSAVDWKKLLRDFVPLRQL